MRLMRQGPLAGRYPAVASMVVFARLKLRPETGEWMQQATVAIRARVPLSVLSDTIQPAPTFSEGFTSPSPSSPAWRQ
jgi:hypothetical protein